jgi:quinol monooxygenase YgiN
MIVVQGEARFHPDDMAMLRESAASMVADTRAEAGCIAYAFAEDVLDPGVVHIAERWADEAALGAHFATPHMARFNAALSKARVLSMKVTAYTVTGEKLLAGG